MRSAADTWAVVLAGGDGQRLSALTTTRQGEIIPKQYCSLGRTHCLIEDALERARMVASSQRICSVVASQHRRWWSAPLASILPQNVFIQPSNRGTAYGILLALLQIEARSKEAVVVLLPADHHLTDESVMAHSLRVAANLASDHREHVYLLGAEPESADPELGYIVPTERRRDSASGVSKFVEKPSAEAAQRLLADGALWNTFILAGSVRALLDLFDPQFAAAVSCMREALADATASEGELSALECFYADLTPLDFSRDVLERQAHRLGVLRVPPCGWTDLGTPKRVEATLKGLSSRLSVFEAANEEALYLDLASARPFRNTAQLAS